MTDIELTVARAEEILASGGGMFERQQQAAEVVLAELAELRAQVDAQRGLTPGVDAMIAVRGAVGANLLRVQGELAEARDDLKRCAVALLDRLRGGTYSDHDLALAEDIGAWWTARTSHATAGCPGSPARTQTRAITEEGDVGG